MSFLYENAATIAVALVSSVIVWLFGGTRGDLLTPVVPWLFVFLLEVVVCFPQSHQSESTYDARARVWRHLKKDVVFWLSLGLMVLLLVPFVNNGLCPLCDAEKIAQGLDPKPLVPFLPYCVSKIDHLNVVWWFAIALPSMIAVRHCLTRKGKRNVLKLIMWNGVGVAMLGFIQGATDAPGPWWCSLPNGAQTTDFFATFGYPNMGGDYFTSLFGIAVALWRDNYEQQRKEAKELKAAGEENRKVKMFWERHYYLIPAGIFFFAALNTLSRAAIILVICSAVIFFVHTLVTFLSRMRKAKRVIVGTWSVGVFSILVFFSTMFMPEKLQKEVDTLGTTEVLDRVTGRGQYHTRVATEIWKDNRLFGCGGWGYLHLCISKMTPTELKSLQRTGGANVHNDYLQFLAEHGIVGFGLMLAIAVMLIWPIAKGWSKLVKDLRFVKDAKLLPAKPIQIFALPAPVFIIMISLIATLIHAFGDCPLRSPAVLTLFYVLLAALPGFMPKSDNHISKH